MLNFLLKAMFLIEKMGTQLFLLGSRGSQGGIAKIPHTLSMMQNEKIPDSNCVLYHYF